MQDDHVPREGAEPLRQPFDVVLARRHELAEDTSDEGLLARAARSEPRYTVA